MYEDGKMMEIEWVMEKLRNENDRRIEEKNKILFLKKWRGDERDLGVKLKDGDGRLKNDGKG